MSEEEELRELGFRPSRTAGQWRHATAGIMLDAAQPGCRPWIARVYDGVKLHHLRSFRGDAIDSGRILSYGTALAAAKAALRRWA